MSKDEVIEKVVGPAVSNSILGSFSISAVIGLVLGGSLEDMWSFINTL